MEDKNTNRPEKLEAGDVQVKNKFTLWFENFWYHYKLQTIAFLFVITVLTVCFWQCTEREVGDVTVTFAGSYTLVNEEKQAFVEVLNAVSPKDEKTGEPISVVMTTYSVYDEETLRSMYYDEDGNFDEVAYQNAKGFNTEHLKNFGTYLMTGESAVLFINDFVFDYQNMEKVAMPLSSLYGENLPASACNDYAIRLGDTDFYKYYKAVQVLPEDTMIVLVRSYVWGASADEETYALFEDLFRSIVDFKMP